MTKGGLMSLAKQSRIVQGFFMPFRKVCNLKLLNCVFPKFSNIFRPQLTWVTKTAENKTMDKDGLLYFLIPKYKQIVIILTYLRKASEKKYRDKHQQMKKQ